MTTSPVMGITEELLAVLESLARAATPGPWWIDSHGHEMVSEAIQLVFRADDRMGPATRHAETGNLSHWPNDWDASFIAAANPATILALVEHIRSLTERLEKAEKDAARYRWLRDDNAYFPEEQMICGGDELDAAIDAAIAQEGKSHE